MIFQKTIATRGLLAWFQDSYLCYFLMYMFYYFSWALASSLISIYLIDKGFSTENVGFIIAMSFFLSMIFQPIIGWLCDKFNQKKVNIALLILSGIFAVFFIYVDSLISIMILYGLLMSFINGTNLVIEKMATECKYGYGKIRIWGTIGFASGSLFSGILYTWISPEAVFICFALTIVLTVIGLGGTNVKATKNSDIKQEPSNHSYKSALIKNKKFLQFLLIAAIFYGCTNTAITFIPAMLQHEGLDINTISSIQSIAVICEAPVIIFGYKFMNSLSCKTLLLITYGIVIFQFITYGFQACIPLQVFATFIGKNLPGMLFTMIALKIVNIVVTPSYQISALALMATVSKNLSTILFQNISGTIIGTNNYNVLFYVLLAIVLIGACLVMCYKVPCDNNHSLYNP